MTSIQKHEDIGFIREVCPAQENRAALGEPLPFGLPACEGGAASQTSANAHCYPTLMNQAG